MINAMQGKSTSYQSFITSHICIKHKTEKFVTAFNIAGARVNINSAGAEVIVLIGQDYKVKFTDVTPNRRFSKLPDQKHPNTS